MKPVHLIVDVPIHVPPHVSLTWVGLQLHTLSQGDPGSAGERGMDGLPGEKGLRGNMGQKGDQGDPGLDRVMGDTVGVGEGKGKMGGGRRLRGNQREEERSGWSHGKHGGCWGRVGRGDRGVTREQGREGKSCWDGALSLEMRVLEGFRLVYGVCNDMSNWLLRSICVGRSDTVT